MKILIILLFSVKTICFSFLQERYQLMNIEFYEYGKKIENVRYYYLNNDTAILIPYKTGKLKIDYHLLNSKHFNMVAIYNQRIIKFRVEPATLNYIKINAYRKGLFKTYYNVSQGSEYDEIVLPYKGKLLFNN